MLQVPLQIVLDDDVPAEARAEIEKAAETLQEFHGRIISCRAYVTTPDRRHRKGGLYDVHVTVRVPRHADIVVSRRVGDAHEREHLDVAIRRVFHEARRQVQDAAREMRVDVKTHAIPDHGHVVKLIAGEDYGFIETRDGREVYFHANSVTDGNFARLKVGDEVRFVEAEGEKGPQASTVVPIGKHHLI